MRHLPLLSAVLLGLTSLSAAAQTSPGTDPNTGARYGHTPGVGESEPHSTTAGNINARTGTNRVAPTLPGSSLGNNAAAGDYLRSARASLAAGQTGKAQEALEMAETRGLDRSVAEGETNRPSDSLFVARVRDALHALGRGEVGHTIELIDQALAI